MTTMTVEQLAALLHMTPRALLNKYYLAPESLPPCLRLPGSKRRLWLESDVHAWLLAHREAA